MAIALGTENNETIENEWKIFISLQCKILQAINKFTSDIKKPKVDVRKHFSAMINTRIKQK